MRLRFILLLLGLITSVGCSGLPRPTPKHPHQVHKIFNAPYDEVWSATLTVLDGFEYSYPLADKDTGSIDTEFKLSSSKKDFIFAGGQRMQKDVKSRLHVRLLAIRGGSPKTRVNISRERYVDRGFLEGFERTQSDLITEKVVLYRIGRIISLEKKIGALRTPQE